MASVTPVQFIYSLSYTTHTLRKWHWTSMHGCECTSAPHSPQTSRRSAPRVYRWAQRWARPACRCSRSRTGMSHRLPGPGCPSLAGARRGRRGLAPFLQLGWDPPPVCVWLPLHSRHSYKEAGRRGQEERWTCQCMAEVWCVTSDLRNTSERIKWHFTWEWNGLGDYCWVTVNLYFPQECKHYFIANR